MSSWAVQRVNPSLCWIPMWIGGNTVSKLKRTEWSNDPDRLLLRRTFLRFEWKSMPSFTKKYFEWRNFTNIYMEGILPYINNEHKPLSLFSLFSANQQIQKWCRQEYSVAALGFDVSCLWILNNVQRRRNTLMPTLSVTYHCQCNKQYYRTRRRGVFLI